MRPGIDYDPDLNLGEFGLDDRDRAKISVLLTSEGPRGVKKFLEAKFGTTFEQLD